LPNAGFTAIRRTLVGCTPVNSEAVGVVCASGFACYLSFFEVHYSDAIWVVRAIRADPHQSCALIVKLKASYSDLSGNKDSVPSLP
jgi:hypothetical protein